MNGITKTILISLFALTSAQSQNAAVSSYLDPQTSGYADVRIREVRIPSSGYTIGTYWCTLGYWTTGSTTGYGGLQWTQDNSQGPKNYIYSQWNDYSTAAYHDPATQVKTFGGEGTGVKSINNDPLNQWERDYWHVTADRLWNEGDKTHFGYIIRNGKSGVWKHIMTWSTPEPNLKITGSYCFLEDWRGDGEYRESQLRKGWNRQSSSESWVPITTYKYNINSYDIESSDRRSYNKRTNWRGGIKSDDTGEFFYMGAGGTVASTNNNNTKYTIARTETLPQEEYGVNRIADLMVLPIENSTKLAVTWESDSLTVPQFIYTITVVDGNETVVTKTDTLPEMRSDTLDISSLDLQTKSYTVTLNVVDFFDGNAIPVSKTIGVEASDYIYVVNPQGGELFEHGDSVTVEWMTDIAADSCRISLLSDTQIDSIGAAAVSDKSVKVAIPNYTESNIEYKIVVESFSDATIGDTSSGFTVFVPDMDHQVIDQSTLIVHSFDSEQNSTTDAADNVIDGNSETFWHTDWAETAVPPHEIVLKTDRSYKLTGLKYLARQDGPNGRIGDYEIYVCTDGVQWGDAVTSGTFEGGTAEQEIHFTETTGQYVKLVALTELSGQAWTAVAELNLLTSGEADPVSIGGSFVSSQNQLMHSVNGMSVRMNLVNGEQYNLALFQVNGRQVYNGSITGNGITTVDFSKMGVANGLYILKLEGVTGVSVVQIPLQQ